LFLSYHFSELLKVVIVWGVNAQAQTQNGNTNPTRTQDLLVLKINGSYVYFGEVSLGLYELVSKVHLVTDGQTLKINYLADFP
jgi:hypothetical protein